MTFADLKKAVMAMSEEELARLVTFFDGDVGMYYEVDLEPADGLSTRSAEGSAFYVKDDGFRL